MGEFYLNLFILCLTLSSEIRASIEFNSKKEGSELYIRKKRLINRSEGGNQPVTIEEVRYIVNIYRNKSRLCGGSILAPIIIITAAHCVDEEATYTILSGLAHKREGTLHQVRWIELHQNFYNDNFGDDVALVKIDPAIDFDHSPNKPINLYEGPVHPHSLATFSGWGCIRLTGTRRTFPCFLRSITVPIISRSECQHYYNSTMVSNKNVCTFDRTGNKGAGDGDSGGPLVLAGRLLGVMSFSNGTTTHPDVFINLAHFHHEYWVISTARRLQAQN